MLTTERFSKPSALSLFLIWTGIGLQSFGGGASTTLLIQRAFIDKRGWMTMEEFIHYWNLCVFAPGINLVALTILIGRKLSGAWGIVLSLLGMLLPSATITCLIAAIFKGIEHIHAVQAIVQGVVPATAGIMLLIGLRFGLPQVKSARKESRLSLFVTLLFILTCIIVLTIFNVSAVLILPCAGLLGILLFSRRTARKEEGSKGK